MSPKALLQLKAKKEEFEGRVPWFYRDGKGWLTIGIGHNLQAGGVQASEAHLKKEIAKILKYGTPNSIAGSAGMVERWTKGCSQSNSRKALGVTGDNFLNSANAGLLQDEGKPAAGAIGVWGIAIPSSDDTAGIEDTMVKEALKITGVEAGQRDAKRYFMCLNSFEITDTMIDKILEADIQAILDSIKSEQRWDKTSKDPSKHFKTAAFPELADFDTFPDEAQMAVVDLAFQMGLNGVYGIGRGAFAKLLKERRWEEAAAMVPSNAQASRNQWRKSLLETAAKVDPRAKKPPAPEVPQGSGVPAAKPK